MKRIIFVLLGAVLAQAACSQRSGTIDWDADLDYLALELPARHCNFFAVHDREYFLAGINAIKAERGTLDDFGTALKTQQLIAQFGDSHTRLDITPLADRSRILPVRLLWTSDGLHVLDTTPDNKELPGRRITAVNGVPVATVIDSLSTLFTVDNKAIVKSWIPELFPSLQVLAHFGFADSRQVELTLEEGKTCILKPSGTEKSGKISFEPDSAAFAVKNRGVLFTDRYFPEEKIYYMLYNACRSRETELARGNKEAAAKMPSFKAFEEQALHILTTRPVDKIVFDMRYNGGGNSAQGREFIEKLAEFLKKNPHISTYVVLGRETFSSAILNAMDFKRLTNAVFVGEETAGKPNHYGEVRSFYLPSSKLPVMYSTKYFKRTDEEVSALVPDTVIEMSFSDFAKGVDPVYEWIRAQ